jgi:ABC-type transport system substrate-binding protein
MLAPRVRDATRARKMRRLLHIPVIRCALSLCAALALQACGTKDGAVDIALIGGEEVDAGGTSGSLRFSATAGHLRAATRQGLVALDESGEIEPALADRWIITDDGRSYIFRLRSGEWPEGGELTSREAKRRYEAIFRELRGTSLARDLTVVDEVRAMAGRVIEFRLTAPMPDFLQLLAQPELAIAGSAEHPVPMAIAREGGLIRLEPLPPDVLGQPIAEDWRDDVRGLNVVVTDAAQAVELFNAGDVDVVLGGTLADWPLAEPGPLSQGTVRLDPAIGLFGLRVRRATGFLAEPQGRAALALAIDREALIAPFGIGGWQMSTRIAGPTLTGDLGTIGERWQNLTMEQRVGEASRRVSVWERDEGKQISLRLALPPGPGMDRLFNTLRSDFARIGITLLRAESGQPVDLELVDRTARYGGVRWFIDQFDCAVVDGPCSPEASTLADQAVETTDPALRAALLAEAEAELTAANVFIPFGPPIRWSLVRSSVTGFVPNRFAFHPLPAFAAIPR